MWMLQYCPTGSWVHVNTKSDGRVEEELHSRKVRVVTVREKRTPTKQDERIWGFLPAVWSWKSREAEVKGLSALLFLALLSSAIHLLTKMTSEKTQSTWHTLYQRLSSLDTWGTRKVRIMGKNLQLFPLNKGLVCYFFLRFVYQQVPSAEDHPPDHEGFSFSCCVWKILKEP